RVGVLRLGGPATTAVPSLEEWPEDLRAAVGPHAYLIDGGYEIDGRLLAPLNEAQVRAACQNMRGDVDAVAVVGVFSPTNPAQEERVEAIVAEELAVPVSLSHAVGSIGLLERENATVLNAALRDTLRDMIADFQNT